VNKTKIILFFFNQGGMKAVIWTDVLQALVIIVGLLAAIIQGCKMRYQRELTNDEIFV
jgi:Na+(H+)/acetate symporter ActP